MMETQEVRQLFSRVESGNMCSLYCQFFLHMRLANTMSCQGKKLIYKYMDLLVGTFDQDSKTAFFGKGSGMGLYLLELNYRHSLYYRGGWGQTKIGGWSLWVGVWIFNFFGNVISVRPLIHESRSLDVTHLDADRELI